MAELHITHRRDGGVRAVPLHLPAEIIDIIISYVDNSGTLCSCMLVCRDWTHASRAVLFEEISIEKGSSYNLLVQRVIHSDALRKYLTSTRVFRIYPDYPDTVTYYAHRVFCDIAGHLPNLRTLTLANISWSKSCPRASEPLLFSSFGQLRKLSLRDCYMPSFNFLRRAVAAIPSLDDLSLFHVTWPCVSPLIPLFSPFHNGPALRRLSIYFTAGDAVVDPLFRWLGGTRSRTSISHLLLFVHESRESYRNTGAIRLRSETLDLLTTLGSHMYLTTLKVTMTGNLSLSMFPSLRTLFIYADALFGPNASQSVLDYGIGFWSTLVFMLRDTHFHLRHLYIRNVVGDLLGRNEDRMYSEQANTILTQDNFENLQLVQFTVMPSRTQSHPTLVKIFQLRLPDLHSRRILKIKVGP